MSYINKDAISVFPLAKNRPSDRSARLFYENNVANIIRQLVDTEGFIILPEVETDLTQDLFVLNNDSSKTVLDGAEDSLKITFSISAPLVFNLYGYYFNIWNESTGTVDIFNQQKLTQDEVDNGFEVWAYIDIDSVAKEILGQDVNNFYEGLVFCTGTTALDVEGRHKLKIADCWIDEDGILKSSIATNSYMKLNSKSLDVTINRIDGKH